MSQLRLLDQNAIKAEMNKLDKGWTSTGSELVRTFDEGDFPSALALVNRVARQAAKFNHQPYIVLDGGEVTVKLTTHEVGGLSLRDFAVARAIDQETNPS